MPSSTDTLTEGLTIGKLSRLTGVNIDTIRYYEKVSMLPAPPRTKNGRRAYGPQETRILIFVRRARELGFSLDEIRALLRLSAPGMASCGEVKKITNHHLQDIRAKLADLAELEHVLAKTIARCSGSEVPDCPVLDILDTRRSK
jgi:MerR family mercuric resistance operon transcriptional regulator